MKFLPLCRYVVLALLVLAAAPAFADVIGDFIGKYEGTAVTRNESGLSKRDLSVTISRGRKQDGFRLEWTTVRYDENKTKRKSYSIDFEPSKWPHVYASAMRTNMFGNRAPLNPLSGEAYVWAVVHDSTLTVYSLNITHKGGYELQQYDRTLVKGGMKVAFSRIRNGEVLRRINGTLTRVGN